MCSLQGDQKAVAVSTGCMASYFLFYSAYDKKTKNLNFSLLQKIFSFNDLDFTARQINKVTGLSALTLAGVGLTPSPLSDGCQRPLLKIAAAIGLSHFMSSSWLYYKCNPRKMLAGTGKNVAVEVPAIFMGIVGLFVMCREAFGDYTGASHDVRSPASYAALLLSLLHFYFIETPTGLPQDLPCRPYAYLSVFASFTAFSAFGFSNLVNYLVDCATSVKTLLA